MASRHRPRARPGMKQVDFFKLERSVQDRFLSACRGEFDPKPILFVPATRPTGWMWLALSPLSVVALWFLFEVGLGDMASAMGRHPQAYMAFYVALMVAFAVGIVQFVAERAASSGLPFRPGFYLFPACLIDARTTVLRVTAIGELKGVGTAGTGVMVTFGARTYRFPADRGYAEQALSAIKLAQMQCSDELEDAARVLLDPLAPPVVVGPFAPDKALVARKPLWVKIRFVAAIAFGVVGVIIFQKRDDMSDAAMFEAAKAKDDIVTYKLYLERGTDHQKSVARLLLPRAELRVAVAAGTVEAIDAFKASYPDTDIAAEVDTARRRSIEVAFNDAAKPATLEALLAFDEKYPGHHLSEHIAAHRHAIYQRALAAYQAMMPKAGKTADFAARLVAFAEKVGPIRTAEGIRGAVAEVRIRAVPSKAMKKADALIKLNQYFVGPKSLPTRYLSREKLQALEQRTTGDYAAALTRGFPKSILRFQTGAEVDGAQDFPKVDKPTLIISYRIEPSGRNYASAKPRGIYIGLIYFFRVDFLLPADDKPHVMKFAVPMKVPGSLVVAHAKKPEGSLETKIYERMSRRAFDSLSKKYLALWLAPAKGK